MVEGKAGEGEGHHAVSTAVAQTLQMAERDLPPHVTQELEILWRLLLRATV